MPSYYAGREALLGEVFGAREVVVDDDHVLLDGRRLPVVDDVIIALDPARRPGAGTASEDYAPDIQHTFGSEWTAHPDVLPEHRREFEAYFDLVDLEGLAGKRVADLGCGSGRWATFVAPHCGTIVLADFSEAIFVARENLRGHENAVFVMADVLDLPFAPDAFDLAYCLGVLHHLPVDALDATRRLAPLAPELLVYLYYALDNRPAYYRRLLAAVSAVRGALARVTSRPARSALTWVLTLAVYAPLAMVGRVAHRLGRADAIPLAETYRRSTLRRMRQDVEDRFFTRIEQRVSRADIALLRDTFRTVTISDGIPYWHFMCQR
jgi:SAM-dependent methyltransferase